MTKEEKRIYHNEWIKKWRAANPDKVKEYRAKWLGGDKEKIREYYLNYMIGWRIRNPEKVRANSLKSDYGMTLEQFKEMLNACGNKCPVCEREFDNQNRSLKPHVDHCHKTGTIRGILCGDCNRAEGILKTSENVFRLLQYLQR